MSHGYGHGGGAMVVEDRAPARRFGAHGLRRARAGRSAPPSRLVSVVVFLAATGLVLAYALPGGAYDIVIRQEYGLVVWWPVALGYALRLLPRTRPSRSTLLLIGSLVAYAAWTALSLIWSVSSERTTAEVARVLDYTGLIVLIGSALDRHTWRAAAMGLGFGASVACALAVASRLAPAAFPLNPFRDVNGVSNRLNYPFGLLERCRRLGVDVDGDGGGLERARPGSRRRAAALGLVPVAALAAYLAYSRASVAGAALGVVAVLALSRHRWTALVHVVVAAGASAIVILVARGAPEIANGTGGHGAGRVLAALLGAVVIAAVAALLTAFVGMERLRLPRTSARIAVGVTLAVLVVIGAALGPRIGRKVWRDFRHPGVTQSAANPASRLTQLGGGRYFYWKAAVDAFKAKPVTGTGAGTYEFSWDQHAGNGDFIRNAHSFELENVAELGIPGLLLIGVVFGVAIAILARVRARVRRSASAGASAALLAGLLVYLLQASVDWMWQSTAVTVLALSGAAVAGARLGHGRPRVRWYWRAAVALAAVGVAALQLPGLISTAALRRSQSAERAGNAALAYAWANSAVSAEPWAASAYEQRGLVLESAGRLAAAATDLRRAIAHEPENFAHWLLLA